MSGTLRILVEYTTKDGKQVVRDEQIITREQLYAAKWREEMVRERIDAQVQRLLSSTAVANDMGKK